MISLFIKVQRIHPPRLLCDVKTAPQGARLAPGPPQASEQLMHAAKRGGWGQVAALAAAGVPVDPSPAQIKRFSSGFTYVEGYTPLECAVKAGNLDAVQMLLARRRPQPGLL